MPAKKQKTPKKLKSVTLKESKEIISSESIQNELETPKEREKFMTLGEHLEELRTVLIKSIWVLGFLLSIGLYFGPELYKIIALPYKKVLGQDAKFFQIQLMAPLLIYLKISFMLSVLFGMPIILSFLWSFVAPAVSIETERYGKFIILFSTVLFWSGVIICWFTVFDKLLELFLIVFNPPDVDQRLPVDEYFDIFFNIHLIFGLSFQLPIVLILLGRIGILSSSYLIEKWREGVIILSVFSAVLSPGPDVFSMMMLFIPLLVLFGLSIIVMRFSEKSKLD
jgi:sec-independent protein translocase protein TatC